MALNDLRGAFPNTKSQKRLLSLIECKLPIGSAAI